LALIDSLMMAYAMLTLKLENVVSAVKKYTSFNASSDLPVDLESTCFLWMAKIAQVFNETVKMEANLLDSQVAFFNALFCF
jgi:calmodulin-regulated spectrin-associated protein